MLPNNIYRIKVLPMLARSGSTVPPDLLAALLMALLVSLTTGGMCAPALAADAFARCEPNGDFLRQSMTIHRFCPPPFSLLLKEFVRSFLWAV